MSEEIWKQIERIIDARLEKSQPAREVVQCLYVLGTERRNVWFEGRKREIEGEMEADKDPPPTEVAVVPNPTLRKKPDAQPRWFTQSQTQP